MYTMLGFVPLICYNVSLPQPSDDITEVLIYLHVYTKSSNNNTSEQHLSADLSHFLCIITKVKWAAMSEITQFWFLLSVRAACARRRGRG